MKNLQNDYKVDLKNRRVLDNGSVKYDLKVKLQGQTEKQSKIIVETTYTVSKRQEDPEQPGPGIKEMAKSFAQQRAKEYEQNIGKDISNQQFSL